MRFSGILEYPFGTEMLSTRLLGKSSTFMFTLLRFPRYFRAAVLTLENVLRQEG